MIKIVIKINTILMAEREGFEPSKQFPIYTLSKRAPSTTRPPLQYNANNYPKFFIFDISLN